MSEVPTMSDLREMFANVLHDHGPGRSGKPPSEDWRDCFNADAHGGTATRLVDALDGFLVVRREDAEQFDVIQDFTGQTRLDPSIMNLKLGPYYVIPVEEGA